MAFLIHWLGIQLRDIVAYEYNSPKCYWHRAGIMVTSTAQ